MVKPLDHAADVTLRFRATGHGWASQKSETVKRGAAAAAPLCHEQEVEMDESTLVSRHLDSKGQALLWALFPMVPEAWDFILYCYR